MSMSSLSVALGQVFSRPADLDANLALAWRWAREASSRGAEVLCLPELFDWGYDLKALSEQGASQKSLELAEVARETGLHLIAGVAVGAGGAGLRNSSLHFSPDGAQEAYAKVHLFEGGKDSERPLFLPGQGRSLWTVGGRKAAPLICYDLRFPELARSLALDGAEILFVSSARPASRTEVFRVLNQARAIENQLFVVSANLCGQSGSGHFAGHSIVVAPDGRILAEGGLEESLLFAELDFSLVAKARNHLPCFQQRRPDAYGKLD
jgi:omega-amidase